MYFILLVILSSVAQCFSSPLSQNFTNFIPGSFMKECSGLESFSCFSNKVSKFIENSMDCDILLFDGIKFLRNNQQTAERKDFRNLTGLNRLKSAFIHFLDNHYFSVDLSEDEFEERSFEKRGGGGGGGGGVGGLGGFAGALGYNRKTLKKETKYAKYAFMVLLGIFGLTGPLVMKMLAMMASKALIASKVALIIVGSVALAKIFEKDEKTTVQVHTIKADEHDRVYIPTNTNHWSYTNPYLKPT